ncbi:carboxymuconolactone decarboxylase family protein [Mycobacterium sp. LTG2003]
MDARLNLLATGVAAQFTKRFHGAALVLDQSGLPKAIRELVSLRASQINGCAMCTDMHTKEATAAGESAVRLHLVAVWREATVFTEAERAALALTEEATRIADASDGVSDETWSEVRKHYDDDQLAALICQIGLINAANRMNVIVRTPAGSYEAGMLASMSR